MWFYLPKTRSSFFRHRKPVSFDDLFKEYRQYKWWNHWKIRESLWTFAFLLIAFRIGTIAFISMFDLWGFGAGIMIHQHKGKLTLPYARSATKTSSSRRHQILVTIHRDGFIMVEGFPYQEDELVQAFFERLQNDPMVIAALIIDREVPMEQVATVLTALRKAHIYRVVFITHSKSI